MSYILDALKKSQQERDAKAVEVGRVPVQPIEQSSNLMPLVWVLVLLMLLLVGLYFWFSSTELNEPEKVQLTEQNVSSKANINNELVEKVEVKHTSKKPVDKPVAVPVIVPVDEPKAVPEPSPTIAKVERRTLPPLAALRRIPALQISSHIYSALPEKRSLTMNNRVWHEGDVIVEGVFIEEITPSGLQLSVDGWPLSISRQQGWQPIPSGY